MREKYRPRRLRRRPGAPRRLLPGRRSARLGRRFCALLMSVAIVLSLLPNAVFAAEGWSVKFVNYDLGELTGNYTFEDVPAGAALYTADQLETEFNVTVTEQAGHSWYLYYPGGGETAPYGPKAIADPPARDGYVFRDWAVQNAASGNINTVAGDTIYVARYLSESRYVVNLYYQFDNESHTVAAETSTVPFGWEETISISLPTDEALADLSPVIQAGEGADAGAQATVAELNEMLVNGSFTGTLNESFLDNCRAAGFVAWDESAQGYQKDENGNVQIGIPVTYQVTGTVEFTVEYLLQNADGSGYTSDGTQEGSVVGTTRVSLNDMEGMVPQYEGFTLTAASAEDAEDYTVNVDSDTVIHLRYDRDTYHILYQMNGGAVREPVSLRYGQTIPASALTAPTRQGYNFTSWTWLDGEGTALADAPGTMPAGDLTLSANWTAVEDGAGVTLVYWLENANDDGYTVSGQWPSQDHLSSGGWFGFRDFYGWGAHALSPYAKSHPGANSVINGIYSTMSADLIVDPEHPEVEHHLTAYYQWNFNGYTLTYHHMFEVVPGVGETGQAFAGSAYEEGYAAVSNVAAGGLAAVQGRQFYEYGNAMTISSLQSAAVQNAPSFGNLTYQYGCYVDTDIYFYYTYNDYTITYNENNGKAPNVVTFHYLEDMTLKEELAAAGFKCDYEPDPYVSQYGNAYAFGGWYTDAEFSFPVEWDTANPDANINVYAKWIVPTFTITLIVPDGTLYQSTLDQFKEKGYTVATSTDTGADGTVTTTYTVSGIPGGIPASQIVSDRRGAQNNYSLDFNYWGYEVNGAEQPYLFDESQYITSDLALTARWKTEYTGQYTVRYLTETPPESGADYGFGTVEVDGKTLYCLAADKVVTNVAVGSSVTEEAVSVQGWLARQGQITRVVAAAKGGQSATSFDFLYDRISAENVTYTVHYVLDAGEDYGRTAPPEGITRLAADKAVTVDQAGLSLSTSVSENAVPVGGYSPRDGWSATFALSGDDDQNHLYFYYVPNTYEMTFTVVYHIPGGSDLTFAGLSAALGRVVTAAELTGDYRAWLTEEQAVQVDGALVGRELDETLTDPWMIVSQGENVYHVHLKNADYVLTYHLEGSEDYPAQWTQPDSFLTAGEGTLSQTVTYPAGATVPATSPTRLGHTFAGWGESPGGPAVDLESHSWFKPAGMTADHHLYALWTAQPVVTYDLRGGNVERNRRWLLSDGRRKLVRLCGQRGARPPARRPQPGDGGRCGLRLRGLDGHPSE